MTHSRHPFNTIRKEFLRKLQGLWPVVKGSIAEVRKPCIRENCQACVRGEKHPAFIFAFTQDGKRRCMYVPRALVPIMRKAIENGRQLESLLGHIGASIVLGYRKQRDKDKGE